jgi:hypothetical protein
MGNSVLTKAAATIAALLLNPALRRNIAGQARKGVRRDSC